MTSVSSELLALSLVNENIFRTFRKRAAAARDVEIMRSTVIIVGILSFTLIFGIHRFTNLFRIFNYLNDYHRTFTLFMGSSYGMLIIGLYLSWTGLKATFYGALTTLLLMTYYIIDSEHTRHYYDDVMSANYISSRGLDKQI